MTNTQMTAWDRSHNKYIHVAVDPAEDDEECATLIFVDPNLGTVAAMTFDDGGIESLRSVLTRAQRQIERLRTARTTTGGEG